MRVPKYSNEDVTQAVITSTSIRQVLSKLKLKEAGGNYKSINRLIEQLQLDTSHFTGKVWNKNKITGYKTPLSDYLTNKVRITSWKLKNRLIEEHIFEHKCSSCNMTEWLNQPIPLELDHIDGNSDNNFLINLRLLCPNCHAFTPTYRTKNIKK